MQITRTLWFVAMLVATTNAYCQRSTTGESCFASGGQADARECLQSRLAESEKTLASAETGVLTAIEKWDEDTTARSRSKSAFRASAKAFRRYRTEQCELQASFASGGSGTTHRRILCALELNEQRIKYLQPLQSSLQ
jgi:uncharacterized protein YecT (DUF1311 family)